MSTFVNGTSPASSQNIDDALAFLLASQLIYENSNHFQVPFTSNIPPHLLILRQMNRLATGEIEAMHPLDPLYMMILSEVFIKPNRLFADKLHIEVNKLRQVKESGGLSQEKVQAWKRVMAYLGVGRRFGGGFQCAYAPDLLCSISDSWPEKSGALQSFFEAHLSAFLPFETASKDLALAVSEPLRYLAEQGAIILESKRDSPNRVYFDEQRYQYITWAGGMS
ncbi:MAG: hypothetical protein ACYDER_17115 [Ktedonobacteraceae bacterium]